MAITTVNEKLALMEEMPWDAMLPISPSTLGTDDSLQLIGEFPFGSVAPTPTPGGGHGSVGGHGRRKGVNPGGVGGFSGVYE